MTSNFATYRSQGRRLERAAVVVRPATLDDAPAIGRISAARHDENEEVHVAGARREIAAQSGPDPTRMIFVAEEAGRVVGYGRLAYFRPPEAAPEHCIPEGWYLTGVVVTPERRNRGIGSRLTAARLDALRGRTDLVRYYANSLNRVSIELHRKLGFAEERRDIWAPSGPFSGGGVGVLYLLRLDPGIREDRKARG